MSEESQAQQQIVNLEKIYLKDVSFETPNSPQVFTKEWQPEINIDLASNGQAMGEDHYENVLTITVTAKNDGEVAFLAEVHQAGIFQISGFSEEQLAHVLGIFCPTTLFPYAREALSSLITRGGFPQMLLNPVNFEALYAQNQQAGTSVN